MRAVRRPAPAHPVLLVTSAERVLLLPGDAGRLHLPELPAGPGASAAARASLGGELLGLRWVATAPGPVPVHAARLLGRAPGRWHWAGPDAEPAPCRELALGPGALAGLDLDPLSRAVLARLLTQPQPLAWLLGARAG